MHAAMGSIVEIVRRCEADAAGAKTPDVFIERQIAKIEGELVKLQDTMKNTNRSPLTGEMAEKNARRCDAHASLIGILKGMCRTGYDPKKKKAAEKVLAVAEKQGRSLLYKSYLQVSSRLAVILDELGTEDLKQAIEATGQTELVAELAAAQEDFVQSFQEKVSLDASSSFPGLATVRAELGYCTRSLFSYIDTNEADGVGDNKQMIKELNEVITYVMSKVRGQQTRNENNHEENDTPPPPVKAT
jgi:hypothetical protein